MLYAPPTIDDFSPVVQFESPPTTIESVLSTQLHWPPTIVPLTPQALFNVPPTTILN